jgi:hypothetical protein
LPSPCGAYVQLDNNTHLDNNKFNGKKGGGRVGNRDRARGKCGKKGRERVKEWEKRETKVLEKGGGQGLGKNGRRRVKGWLKIGWQESKSGEKRRARDR